MNLLVIDDNIIVLQVTFEYYVLGSGVVAHE